MIEPSSFYNELKKEEIDFFVGVPDSLLKNFCSFVDDNIEKVAGNYLLTYTS